MYYKPAFIKVFFIVVILTTAFAWNGCKKYPENTLWFKKPEKVFKGGKITSYTMNGIDRMPYYINLYKIFPYNYYGSSIDNVFNTEFTYNSGTQELKSDIGRGTVKFSSTKREVEISFEPVNVDYGPENIFMARLSWKIMELTKNGQMKIKADYNFKTYEIQFN